MILGLHYSWHSFQPWWDKYLCPAQDIGLSCGWKQKKALCDKDLGVSLEKNSVFKIKMA